MLPFGLSTAGYIFTKKLRHPVKFLRAQGIKIIMYLDDGIAAAENFKKANSISENIHSDLDKFVFLIAEEKSDWLPKQSVNWLGLNINFSTGQIHLTKERISDILTGIMSCFT